MNDEHGMGRAGLIINGCIHEASYVPTTLHRARMPLGVGPREDPGPFHDLPSEAESQSMLVGFLGGHMPCRLGIVFVNTGVCRPY